MIVNFFRSHPIHKRITPRLDHVFLLRPTLFFPVWVMASVGMAAARLDVFGYSFWTTHFDWTTVAFFLGITLISGATFIINQIKDKDGDELNDKLFLVGKYISIPNAQQVMYGSLILGLLLTLFVGKSAFILGVLLFGTWGILYNVEPFHFKKRPIMGMVTNTLAGLIIYTAAAMHVYESAGLSIEAILTGKMLLVAIPYMLCYTATSLLTTIPDILGDRETGAQTFPIIYGVKNTILIGTIMVIIALVMAVWFKDPVCSLASLLSLPFYIVAMVKQSVAEVLRAIRYSVLFLALFVMLIYPLLFPAVLIVFYLSKYYYWHRFNLVYPTFDVSDQSS